MSQRARMTVGTLIGAATIGIGVVSLGRYVMKRRIAREIAELHDAASGPGRGVITESDLAGLPEPVQRWLRWANVVDREYPVTVRLSQEGEFRLREDQAWMQFTATQHYTTNPPGFVWSASMRMMPLVAITGRDRYRDGIGDIDMRLASLVPVARKRGGGLNQGALLRYLNEAMWFPAAMISPYITWQERDSMSAIATMTYGGESASATWHFDDEGRVITMTADRFNDDRNAMLPWSTPITDYGEFAGVRIPTQGTGVWHYGRGDFTYIRLRIVDIEWNTPLER